MKIASKKTVFFFLFLLCLPHTIKPQQTNPLPIPFMICACVLAGIKCLSDYWQYQTQQLKLEEQRFLQSSHRVRHSRRRRLEVPNDSEVYRGEQSCDKQGSLITRLQNNVKQKAL